MINWSSIWFPMHLCSLKTSYCSRDDMQQFLERQSVFDNEPPYEVNFHDSRYWRLIQSLNAVQQRNNVVYVSSSDPLFFTNPHA